MDMLEKKYLMVLDIKILSRYVIHMTLYKRLRIIRGKYIFNRVIVRTSRAYSGERLS